MADDPKDTPATGDDPKPETGKPDAPDSDDVKAIKAALKKANKEAETFRLKVKELEDKEKSDSEKLSEKAADAEKRAQEAEIRAMRLEVAFEKGLKPAQAKRLVGTTKEELEEDADDFLASIAGDDKGKPGTKPTEDLKGGGDPTEDPLEMNPKKLADMVERY